MTTLDDQFDAIFKELKIEPEFNENLSINVKKTLRLLVSGKGGSTSDTWWESLKKNKRLTHHNLTGKEAEARGIWMEELANWEDDHDSDDEDDVSPVFEPRDVLLPILASCGKDETVITNLRGNVTDLKAQLEHREDVMEQMQREYMAKLEEKSEISKSLSIKYSETLSALQKAEAKIKELTAAEPDALSS
jgi:hypothetical protein